MTIEPKPYALRRSTCTFGVVACVWAANMRAPLRNTPARSDRVPGSTPGLSARNTSGTWNESATIMKWAALSAASASTEPASTLGWLATTATGSPPRRARPHTTARPKPGWISNHSWSSTSASITARTS